MDISCVAVIILNYNTWEDTLNEASLVHSLFGLEWDQIIIVDNDSQNESAARLKEKTVGDYVFLESDENRGYASGNNIGLRYARDKGFRYGWILNNDILMDHADVLSEMLRVFGDDDSLAVVNPDIYSPDGYLFNRDSQRPSFYDMTFGILAYRKKGRVLEDLGGYGYVYRPQGCCMMVDLDKMESVGYMDERTFLYCEEIILAERLLDHSFRCACAFNTKVVHNHSKTVKSALSKWNVIRTQNSSYDYYLKNYRGYGIMRRSVCLIFYTAKNCITN